LAREWVVRLKIRQLVYAGIAEGGLGVTDVVDDSSHPRFTLRIAITKCAMLSTSAFAHKALEEA
jgi:hypothetical protein